MIRAFQFDEYKSFLKASLKERGANGRGHQAEMARAAGCQASYLAQALNSKVELTPDHAAGIANFMNLKGHELEYFLNLVNLSRASTPELKRILSDKLKHLKEVDLNLSQRIQNRQTDFEQAPDFYYSSWIWMAIHMGMFIESLTTPIQLAERFGISVQNVIEVLDKLKEWKIVSEKKGQWSPTAKNIHLPETSYMNGVSHRNWRERAGLDVEKSKSSSIHYTSVFTMSREDAQKLRSEIVDLLEKSRRLASESQSEEVFCFLSDFFQV